MAVAAIATEATVAIGRVVFSGVSLSCLRNMGAGVGSGETLEKLEVGFGDWIGKEEGTGVEPGVCGGVFVGVGCGVEVAGSSGKELSDVMPVTFRT